MHIRNIARRTASEAIELQKQEMRQLGVMANWDSLNDTYRTMDHDYQIRQLRIFKQMVDDGESRLRSSLTTGHIVHRLKPTYYSPAAQTALAEAELRYMDDHESRSVYVALPVSKPSPRLAQCGTDLDLAIWTTTPWTLPSNMAVAVGDLPYSVVQSGSRFLVVQTDRIEPLEQILGPLTVLHHLKGKSHWSYTHFRARHSWHRIYHPPTSQSPPRPPLLPREHRLGDRSRSHGSRPRTRRL